MQAYCKGFSNLASPTTLSLLYIVCFAYTIFSLCLWHWHKMMKYASFHIHVLTIQDMTLARWHHWYKWYTQVETLYHQVWSWFTMHCCRLHLINTTYYVCSVILSTVPKWRTHQSLYLVHKLSRGGYKIVDQTYMYNQNEKGHQCNIYDLVWWWWWWW